MAVVRTMRTRRKLYFVREMYYGGTLNLGQRFITYFAQFTTKQASYSSCIYANLYLDFSRSVMLLTKLRNSANNLDA